ncbi:Hypothetical predicted protein [Octopus vulgaris]|uniref:Uncharacterized protein n=1 Tax=Octopus vulgaris TaxID=6645 RepID=A0AA36FHM0_OCTVU|nr:Hypothetical predicted protein [Octopus vulgaris]
MRWYGHTVRMTDKGTPKQLFNVCYGDNKHLLVTPRFGFRSLFLEDIFIKTTTTTTTTNSADSSERNRSRDQLRRFLFHLLCET